MNKALKHTLLGLCGGLLVICIACAFIAGRHARKGFICEQLEVVILDSLENSFVSESDIKTILDKGMVRYIGKPIDSLDLVKMEKVIDDRSAVLKSHAYVTKDGTLHIDVTQRRPVVRFQKKDGGFYADAEGYIFQLQSSYSSHVQIVDGHIPLAANSGYKGEITNPDEKEWFNDVMKLINYMENSRMWKDKIVQINVAENGDMTLIPREGKERFIFGYPEDIQEKFGKMELYYTAVIPEKGQDTYSRIDLRYKGQLVCK